MLLVRRLVILRLECQMEFAFTQIIWLWMILKPGKFQLKITYIVTQIHDDKIIGSLSSHLVQIKGLIVKFKMIHENYNVSDLDRSIKFYTEALDLHEVRRKTADDFIIVYLSNDVSDFELELTWLKDHPQPYNLGE